MVAVGLFTEDDNGLGITKGNSGLLIGSYEYKH